MCKRCLSATTIIIIHFYLKQQSQSNGQSFDWPKLFLLNKCAFEDFDPTLNSSGISFSVELSTQSIVDPCIGSHVLNILSRMGQFIQRAGAPAEATTTTFRHTTMELAVTFRICVVFLWRHLCHRSTHLGTKCIFVWHSRGLS